VEGHNFDTRKQLVEYDDVMNRHREVIYSRRRKALAAESLRADILEMIRKELEAMVQAYTDSRTNEVNHAALREAIGSFARCQTSWPRRWSGRIRVSSWIW
jgi:preprotein translocase subunit SecA